MGIPVMCSALLCFQEAKNHESAIYYHQDANAENLTVRKHLETHLYNSVFD